MQFVLMLSANPRLVLFLTLYSKLASMEVLLFYVIFYFQIKSVMSRNANLHAMTLGCDM